MSVNFPTNRQEAGLSPGGALIQGDIWRYHSIEYTWVVAPDGTGYWSSKGININPDLYIAKSEVFEANGGTISGNYAGTSPFAVGHATSSDSATALETARTIGGVSFDGTSNINLPGVNSPGTQDTSGTAATATSADKVDHSLTLTFVDANSNSTQIVYDGSSAKSLTFTDTDVAQDVITITGGTGIDVVGTTIDIADNVARVPPNGDGYIYNGIGTALKVKNADSVGGIASGNILQTDNTTLAKVQTGAPTISTGGYVVNSSGNGLKVFEADRASKDLTGTALVNMTTFTNTINSIDTSGSGRIHCDIRNYEIADQTSWDLAFSNCMAANGTVYLPAGTYNFVSTVGRNSGSANVYGDGSGQTILNFDSGHGLTFSALKQGTDWDTVNLRGFTINSTSATGTGINIQYVSSGNVAQKVYCEDVTVTNFATGWNLVDTDLSTYNHCSALGCSTTGIYCQSSAVGDAVNIRFNNWQIGNCTTGINIDTRAEGVYVTDTLIIACTTGVKFKGNTQGTGAAEPYFVMRGCNLDVLNTGLILDASMQSTITDNLFYKRPNTTNATWTGIIVKGAPNNLDNVITDNIFNGINKLGTRIGIDIQQGLHSTYSDNTFITVTTAFNLATDSAVGLNQFHDNVFRDIGEDFNGISVSEHISTGNLVKQKALNGRFEIINGDGVQIADADTYLTGGFKLTPGGGNNNTGGGTSVYPGTNVFTVSTEGNFTTNLKNAINSAISGEGHVFIPAGDHTLSGHIVTDNSNKKHQVSIFGAGAYSTEIKTNGWRIVFRQPVNIRDIAFTNGGESNKGNPDLGSIGNTPRQAPVTAMLNFWRYDQPAGTAQEDDMDSSMIDCHIQGPNFGYAIAHRGRNFKFHNNRVIKYKEGSPLGALYLDYANAEVNGIQGELGWRRLSIVGNTFHSWKDATCITFGFSAGSVPCYGALISDNTVDHGGQFLLTTNTTSTNLLTCCNISDNTMHYISNNDSPVIDIGAINSSITNNPVCKRGAGLAIRVNGFSDTNGTGNNNNIINNPTPLVRN